MPRFEPPASTNFRLESERPRLDQLVLKWWRRFVESISPLQGADDRCDLPAEEIDEDKGAEKLERSSGGSAKTGAVETPPQLTPRDASSARNQQQTSPPRQASRPRLDRIIPITRRRLRQEVPITWPATLGRDANVLGTAERLELLKIFTDLPSEASGETLARAYLEEDLEGRVFALRALVSGGQAEGPSIFREALRRGTEIERTLAIEGLQRHRRYEELLPALHDRVEAIAAKAALAFARTQSRREFAERLERHVSGPRLEALLELLVGLRP